MPVGASLQLGPNATRLLGGARAAARAARDRRSPRRRRLLRWDDGIAAAARRARRGGGAVLRRAAARLLPTRPAAGARSTRSRRRAAARRRASSASSRRTTRSRSCSRTGERHGQTPSWPPTGSGRRSASSSSAPTIPSSPAPSSTAASSPRPRRATSIPTASTATGSARTATASPTGSASGALLAFNLGVRRPEWAQESWTLETPARRRGAYLEGWDTAFVARFRRCGIVLRGAVYVRRPLEHWTFGRIDAARRRRARDGAVPGAGRRAGGRGRLRARRVSSMRPGTTSRRRSPRYEQFRMARAAELQRTSRGAGDELYLPTAPSSGRGTRLRRARAGAAVGHAPAHLGVRRAAGPRGARARLKSTGRRGRAIVRACPRHGAPSPGRLPRSSAAGPRSRGSRSS